MQSIHPDPGHSSFFSTTHFPLAFYLSLYFFLPLSSVLLHFPAVSALLFLPSLLPSSLQLITSRLLSWQPDCPPSPCISASSSPILASSLLSLPLSLTHFLVPTPWHPRGAVCLSCVIPPSALRVPLVLSFFSSPALLSAPWRPLLPSPYTIWSPSPLLPPLLPLLKGPSLILLTFTSLEIPFL